MNYNNNSNLPAQINHNQFQFSARQERREFMPGWGIKSGELVPGDFIVGIILGFEKNEFNTSNIILKNIVHGLQQRFHTEMPAQFNFGEFIRVFSCATIEQELYRIEEKTDASGNKIKIKHELLFQAGDVIRITFLNSYIGKKGLANGKTIAVFKIDGLDSGYQLTPEDYSDVQQYQQQLNQNKPLAAYQPAPQQQLNQQNNMHRPQQIPQQFNQQQNFKIDDVMPNYKSTVQQPVQQQQQQNKYSAPTHHQNMFAANKVSADFEV